MAETTDPDWLKRVDANCQQSQFGKLWMLIINRMCINNTKDFRTKFDSKNIASVPLTLAAVLKSTSGKANSVVHATHQAAGMMNF